MSGERGQPSAALRPALGAPSRAAVPAAFLLLKAKTSLVPGVPASIAPSKGPSVVSLVNCHVVTVASEALASAEEETSL